MTRFISILTRVVLFLGILSATSLAIVMYATTDSLLGVSVFMGIALTALISLLFDMIKQPRGIVRFFGLITGIATLLGTFFMAVLFVDVLAKDQNVLASVFAGSVIILAAASSGFLRRTTLQSDSPQAN